MYLISCSLIMPGSAPPVPKSDQYAVKFASPGWRPVSSEDSDHAYVHESGDYLLVNSACETYQETDLRYLAKKAVAHLENLSVQKVENLQWNQRKAVRLQATGELDGVTVAIDILTTRRNHCFYDFLFIAARKDFSFPSAPLSTLLEGVTFQ